MRRLTDAERDEAEKHIGLVKFFVGKLSKFKRRIEIEDQIQEGMIGVMRSVQSHDPSRTKFSTYARQAIRTFVTKADMDYKFIRIPQYLCYDTNKARKQRDKVESAPLVFRMDNDALSQQKSAALAVVDGEDDEKDEGRDFTDPGLCDALKSLSEEQRYIIERLFVEGATIKEIAKRMKKSPSRVSFERHAALQKLRENMQAAV
jgi:RNA polymerase sigma factor (sigma-70 family)